MQRKSKKKNRRGLSQRSAGEREGRHGSYVDELLDDDEIYREK